MHRCARLLLDAGADPNQSWKDKNNDHALSALYGAAGKNHDPGLTRMLLEAGANPNDGESLYHAVETTDPACARLLLAAGAKVEGSNALHHVLDRDGLGTRERDNNIFHPASSRRFVSIRRGMMWIKTSDGETRRFQSGDMVEILDIAPSKGHISWVGTEPVIALFSNFQ